LIYLQGGMHRKNSVVVEKQMKEEVEQLFTSPTR
jgi:hypothetical protein